MPSVRLSNCRVKTSSRNPDVLPTKVTSSPNRDRSSPTSVTFSPSDPQTIPNSDGATSDGAPVPIDDNQPTAKLEPMTTTSDSTARCEWANGEFLGPYH